MSQENKTQLLREERTCLRRENFARLLRDMFQLDQPDLDFGMYRIMHAKKSDINRFINEDLPKMAQDAFANFVGLDKAKIETDIQEARKAALLAGISPDDSPRLQELEARFAGSFDTAREEGEVYDALVTFFSRYYDEGDFVSQRIFKGGGGDKLRYPV